MKNKLYIQMFSVHGLLRHDNLELGRDADTGGQISYVMDLVSYLSLMDQVGKVDLFTRLISDKAVSEDYARPIEQVNDKLRIVRVQCGGKKYIRKELLWPHLDEFVDKTISFIKRENTIPDIVHGHYADGGYVGSQIAMLFAVPFVFTGHSLGRTKKQKLLNDGAKEADIIKNFKIDHRIRVEETILEEADLVVTSTRQEIEKQYGLYQNRHRPMFRVIPPGLNMEKFYPYYHDRVNDFEKKEALVYAHASVLEELNRFFLLPDKPLILTLCRPDKRKNISGLIRAYGEDEELQSIANIAIFAGIRKDISRMEANEQEVLTEMLLLMDKFDLYGKMAIPKRHEFEYEVPELYRIAAEKRGVFVNSALTEPFGLTLIEAAASGLPVVATNDGGPKDIIRNCKCGILVDATNTRMIGKAIKDIITNNERWKKYSKDGIINVHKHYTWASHAKKYLKETRLLARSSLKRDAEVDVPSGSIGKRLVGLNYLIISDIDNTLTGGDNAGLQSLMRLLKDNYDRVGFGVATGRTVDSAVAHLNKHGVMAPDVIISSVGSEIYYGKELLQSKGWETHISHKWDRDKVKSLLDTLEYLTYQDEATQRRFKVSYDMAFQKDRIVEIHNLLQKNKCRYNLAYSHGKHLDILPYRASKGKAIRYLSYKWEIPLQNLLICGDSGNDEDMLRGEPPAVVVGNYSRELERLKGQRNIYFSTRRYAEGILDGIDKYGFMERVSI